MNQDFQRLPLLGAVVASLEAGRQVVIAAVVVAFFDSPSWVLVASLVGFGITTAYHFAKWLTFRISIDRSELRTSHVFITRSDRRIPIASIHDLFFEQTLLQRMLGVVTVRIETAGGSGSEADLPGLLRPQAEALKAAIDTVRVGSAPAVRAASDEPPELVVARLGFRDLVVAGASSATIWIVGGALFSTWFFLDDLIPGLEQKARPYFESITAFLSASDVVTLIASVAGLVVLLLIVAAVVSIARTCIRFWGFRATWNGSRLLRSCGLFTKRRQVLRASRIQRILIRQSVLQRLCGVAVVELGTAALGSRQEEDHGRSFTIPIIRAAQIQPLLDLLAPGAEGIDGTFDPVSPLAARRYLLRSAAFFAVLSAGLALGWPRWAPAVWLLYVRSLVRAPRLARVGGSRVTADLVQFRSGAFARRLVTLPHRRLQGVQLTQTVFDRRLGLAQVHVAAAGNANTGELADIPEERARSIVETVVARAVDLDGEQSGGLIPA